MTRSKKREQAFFLIFENTFKNESTQEIIETADEVWETPVSSFAKEIFIGVEENKDKIDNIIEKFSKKWRKGKFSKVAFCVMRIAIYEMIYVKNIPSNVSINEAVEIAKKYGGEQDYSFVNGTLGKIFSEIIEKGNVDEY